MVSLRRPFFLRVPPRLTPTRRTVGLAPVVLLSAAWTVSLVGSSPAAVSGPSAAPPPPGAVDEASPASVPAQVIEEPASVGDPVAGTAGRERTSVAAQQIVSTSSTNGIPSAALTAYQRAEAVLSSADASCRLPWQLIAAVGRVESDHGRAHGNTLNARGLATPGIFGIALDGSRGTATIRDSDAGSLDGDRRFDRAVGPMQFIPATWAVVGVDADSDGVRNVQDIDDAALAAAVYLCSGRGDLSTTSGQRASVYRYNHSASYVDLVLDVMDSYLEGDFTAVPDHATAAGYLTPLPALAPASPAKQTQASPSGGQPEAEAAAAPAPPPVSAEPSPEADEQQDAGDERPAGGGGRGGPLPDLPSIKLPDPPKTKVEPVDEVLTLAQALVQCTLDGLIDNPFSSRDRFDACLDEYTS
jgi:membrane-bound lytic murein transglycosylase B